MIPKPPRRCRECAATLDGRPGQTRYCSVKCAVRKFARLRASTYEGRARHRDDVVRSRERVRLRSRSIAEVAEEDVILGIGQ